MSDSETIAAGYAFTGPALTVWREPVPAPPRPESLGMIAHPARSRYR